MTSAAQIEDSLLASLATIRAHWSALLLPSSGGMGGIAGSDPVTGLDRRVSLRHEVTLCLNGWARVVVEDRELTARLPLGNDTLGLIVLLERHALWLSSHEAGADAAVEIAEWAREVKRTATPERREWMPLGV